MSYIVFIETSNGFAKKSSKETLSFAARLKAKYKNDQVIGVVTGNIEEDLSSFGQYGANKILHYKTDAHVDEVVHSQILSSVFNEFNGHTILFARSPVADVVMAKTAVRNGCSVVSNIAGFPEIGEALVFKRSVFTGKAYEFVSVNDEKLVLGLGKGASHLSTKGESATVDVRNELPSADQPTTTFVSRHQSEGDILLSEAELIVSAGRGLKGPENWPMIEDLAKALGAATGCSKPVSDMGWRPHHEHVGQTGIKVSPDLYLAVAISGAIQHLAGISSSKVVVAINKDGEAPFFEAADYGIIGDAFEIVPKLTKAIQKLKQEG